MDVVAVIPTHRLKTCDWLVLAVLTVLAVMAGHQAVRAPRDIGWYLDDTDYLATSKALADGHGYRHIELPGAPLQTKYPPAYPALLALIWRIWPDFPANIAYVQVLNAALWLLGSWLAYRLMRRLWQLPWWIAGFAAAVGFTHPATQGVLQSAMSEPLYFVLSLASLCVLELAPLPADGTATPRRRLRPLMGGLLAGVAGLARTIGVTLVGAAVLASLLRRQARSVLPIVLGAGLLLGAWQGWVAYGNRANASIPEAAALRYQLDYNAWVPRDLAAAGRVVLFNIPDVVLTTYAILLPYDKALLERDLPDAWLIYVLMLVMLSLYVTGFVATFRRQQAGVHLYVLATLAMIVIWPFSPARLLLPIHPFLVAFALVGLYATLLRCTSLLSSARRAGQSSLWDANRPGAELTRRVLVGALVLFGIVRGGGAWQPDPAEQTRHAEAVRAFDDLATLIRTATPPDAVISAPRWAYVYLLTNRVCVPPMIDEDPVPSRYPPDRPWLGCGVFSTPGRMDVDCAYMRANLLPHLRRSGAQYVAHYSEPGFAYDTVFREMEHNPEVRFEQSGAVGKFRLLRIRWR